MSGAARKLLEEDALPRGTLVGERFRVVRMLGAGGMGAVYEAEDTQIDRRVAIKILYVAGPKAALRFEREVRAASRISSRYVAAVHDCGRDPAHGLYMVMELLEGRTLDAVLAREGALAPARAAELAAEIAEALAAAHEAGVVHRDLKPPNVMVLADGSVKVLDFGVARLEHDARGPQLTAADVVLGTPAYVSPEAVAGRAAGPAADLYALGVILFEMLAGTRPFADDVPAVLCTKHLTEAPPRLADMRGDDEVAAYEPLVAALLEKDPADRPEGAADVAAALRALAAGDASRVVLPRRRRARTAALWVAASTIALGVAIGAALALVEPRPATVEVREPEPVAAQVAPPPLPTPEPPPPARVEVRVATTPSDATLLLDGEPASSPLSLERGSEHELIVRARGHREERVRLVAEEDRLVEVTLTRAPRRGRRLPVKLRSW